MDREVRFYQSYLTALSVSVARNSSVLRAYLFLVKKLFERSQVGHFQFARVGIVLETNRISVHYETRRYEAERQLCSSTFGVKVLAS